MKSIKKVLSVTAILVVVGVLSVAAFALSGNNCADEEFKAQRDLEREEVLAQKLEAGEISEEQVEAYREAVANCEGTSSKIGQRLGIGFGNANALRDGQGNGNGEGYGNGRMQGESRGSGNRHRVSSED